MCNFLDNVEKYCRAGQAADDNMTSTLHAGYLRLQTHFQNMYTYCFSTATVVAQIHLNVMLLVYCLSSYFCPNLYQIHIILLIKRKVILAMENAKSCYLFFLCMNCFEEFSM